MAKSDAPNYRKATTNKKCGNCKAWDSSKTDDPMTGYCEWYDFNCRADHVCDAWAPDDFEKAWPLVKERRCEADVDPRCTGEADFIVEGDTMEGGGYVCSRCIDHYGGDGEVHRLD